MHFETAMMIRYQLLAPVEELSTPVIVSSITAANADKPITAQDSLSMIYIG